MPSTYRYKSTFLYEQVESFNTDQGCVWTLNITETGRNKKNMYYHIAIKYFKFKYNLIIMNLIYFIFLFIQRLSIVAVYTLRYN